MRRILNTSLFVAIVAAMCVLANVGVTEAHPEHGCESCHVPHNASTEPGVPLWNPEHDTTLLTGNYSSPTMDADMSGPIDGASKLCLSCHDGTYPHIRDPHAVIDNLSTAHPISFVYDEALYLADGELVDPSTLAEDILDENNKMQCTSCHDVHATFAAAPNLRWPYENDFSTVPRQYNNAAFCRNCHVK